MLLKPMIVLITGHCLENYSTDQFIFLLLECLYWYTKQELCIRWGSEISPYFTISNGVRQGGILSPSLFAIYIYIYIYYSLLNTSRIGCHIDDVCINHVHVCYAEDLCLMPPCPIALQELINVCYQLYYCIICLFRKHSPYKSLQI